MPYHLTAHEPYTERLEGNTVRIWKAGEDVTDPAAIKRLSGHPYFVRHWVDDPAPIPASDKPVDPPAPEKFAAVTRSIPDPADAPVKS